MKLQEELNSLERKLLNISLGKVVKLNTIPPLLPAPPKPPSTWIYGLFCLCQVLISFINTCIFISEGLFLKTVNFFAICTRL